MFSGTGTALSYRPRSALQFFKRAFDRWRALALPIAQERLFHQIRRDLGDTKPINTRHYLSQRVRMNMKDNKVLQV